MWTVPVRIFLYRAQGRKHTRQEATMSHMAKTMSRTEQLLEQFDWHWREALRPRLEGLGDDEYLWEPVPGCWSLRRRGEVDPATAAGAGEHVMEYAYPEPDPPPVTTIAWRLGHIAIGIFGMRASAHFGDASVTYQDTDWPPTAAGGIALLEHHYEQWRANVAGMDDADLERPVGPAEGPWAEAPYSELLLHLNREAIHHGAEVALLRDLYRATAGAALPVREDER